jgi:hypothetical protein
MPGVFSIEDALERGAEGTKENTPTAELLRSIANCRPATSGSVDDNFPITLAELMGSRLVCAAADDIWTANFPE